MVREPDPRDDGEAVFDSVTLDGKPVTLEELLRAYLDVKPDFRGAIVGTCRACGGTALRIDDGIDMGSTDTGLMGEVDLECVGCHAYRTLWRP